jgi:hypothetical protein
METKTGARALAACLSITRILLAKEARITQMYSGFPAFDRVRLLTEFVQGWRVERRGPRVPMRHLAMEGMPWGDCLRAALGWKLP